MMNLPFSWYSRERDNNAQLCACVQVIFARNNVHIWTRGTNNKVEIYQAFINWFICFSFLLTQTHFQSLKCSSLK